MPSPSLFTSVINSYLPEPHASLLNGIVFGTPLKTSKLFYEQLRTVGLLHLVVLSGMNITMLAVIIVQMTSFLNKKLSITLTIITIFFFILFVGPQAPAVRAAIMGILTLVAVLTGRKIITLYALFISAFLIFIFWPAWIGGLSFQLSFAATLGLILFGTVKINEDESSMGKVKAAFWKEVKPSLAAQIFTAPLLLLYFNQISIIAPVANVLVAFTIPPLMILGFLTAILGKIHYVLGFMPSLICYGLLNYIILVVTLLAKIPFANLHW